MQVPRIAARAGSEEKQPAGLVLWLQALVAELLLFAKIVLLAFEHVWEKPAVCRSQASMEGSTVVVTGATSGVGKETALELARRGARVVIGCRNLQKARLVAQEIFDRTQQRVIVKHLDMNSLKSVRHFCDDVIKTEDRLDVLINNAGAIGHSKKVKLTEDGFEEIFQANYLAPLLLTVLLLDLLKKSSPSRVINVASDFHRLGEVGNVADKARGVNSVANPTAVYGNAKLALCMVTVALADRLRGTGVTVNSLHPGAVKTHIVDEGPGVRKFLFELILGIKGKTPQEGAQTSVRLAVDPELEQTSGEYFENCAPAAARYRSAHLADHRLADEVLRSSLELLGWRDGRW
ncbi:retinol dehydrogenase 11-like isoform X1 [Dermacentor andersoni]|uniref:retinol dehydrogenase 11-like isoform X1 n=1 Tax=Dermacentor andersoni TaxID=34620 RepID=UPI002154FF14|nr:retinol dehydrogenase 11-like isoform X1 [Dermacentor andersoni]